jgi:hypothetical protein
MWICAPGVHKFAAAFGYFRSRILRNNNEKTRQTKTFNMKKTVLFAAAIFTVAAATAQTGEITSAKGENWLSQDGDWGLTFDAQPLLNYAGNLFNNGTNNNTIALNSLWGPGNTFGGANKGIVIGGKKLIDANTAYRGRVRIGFGSNKQTEQVDANPQPTPPPTPTAQVDDVQKMNYLGITLGGGLEKRVGSTRVVGIYGGELDFSIASSKTTYEYGNALSAQNTVNGNAFGAGNGVTEIKNGSTFGLALFGFAGVEWFAAPKISIGGEVSWGVGLASRGIGETTSESFNTASNSVQSVTVEGSDGSDKESTFTIDTGISGATVNVNFYFQ